MQLFNDIESFIGFVESQKRFSKKVSLDNMDYFLSLFEHPEHKFNSIHVTGTNGKGSTVSYLKNIYLAGGYNVATFTSPYVIKFNHYQPNRTLFQERCSDLHYAERTGIRTGRK